MHGRMVAGDSTPPQAAREFFEFSTPCCPTGNHLRPAGGWRVTGWQSHRHRPPCVFRPPRKPWCMGTVPWQSMAGAAQALDGEAVALGCGRTGDAGCRIPAITPLPVARWCASGIATLMLSPRGQPNQTSITTPAKTPLPGSPAPLPAGEPPRRG